MNLPSILLTTLALVSTPVAQDTAAEWPQWRGPNRDGVAADASWTPTGGKQLWYTNVGLGYSTVSIQGGRLFTMGNDQEEQEDTVFCLDPDTGKTRWTFSFEASTLARMHGGGSLTTPSADGERVFISNRQGRLFCLDSDSGELLWSKHLADEHNVRSPMWGFSASPLVLDGMVVMNLGYVLAFDRDGNQLWKTERNYKSCYSTPVDMKVDGRACLAVFNGIGLTILDRKTGKDLSTHEWNTRSEVNAASPVVIGDKVFISSGYNKGCAMLQASANGLELLWESKVMRNQMSGCVHFAGHLYGFDESTLKCLDLDGDVKWSQRGLGKGALVIAGGKLVMVSSKGELVIAEATAEEYRELSRKKILFDGVNWTTPVVLGGKIYCRSSMGDLLCMDHRE